jgi:hypothetical protein
MKFSFERVLFFVMLFQRMGGAAPVPVQGTLTAAVVDTTGNYVSTPKLYAYHQESKHTFEAEGTQGVVSISLPPGHYRVYSASLKKDGDFVERYMSYEAHVRVMGGEAASVILKTGKATPSRVYLSENARKKIGLAPELAQYVN